MEQGKAGIRYCVLLFLLAADLFLLGGVLKQGRIADQAKQTASGHQTASGNQTASGHPTALRHQTALRQLELMQTAAGELQVQNKKIAITFDDGPHPVYTEKLLDGLKEREVHATFFVTGENAESYPELILRMQEEGHLVGNHTYSHIQLRKDNRDCFREELVKTNEILKEITGEEVLFIRPPYGAWDKQLEQELNMFPVLWTIDPLDWCSRNASCITKSVLSKAKENSIILLHDEYATTVQAALQIVDTLKQEGYEFVTVEELMLD